MALDQLLWTPPLTVAFFSWQHYFSGQQVTQAVESAVDKLLPTLKYNWTVWPLIHVVTFAAIPLEYRMLWVNCANLAWNTFLSSMANEKQPDAKEKAQ